MPVSSSENGRSILRSTLAYSVQCSKFGNPTRTQVEASHQYRVSGQPRCNNRQSYKHRTTPFFGSVRGIGYQDLPGAFGCSEVQS
jgi:hypothetical protein